MSNFWNEYTDEPNPNCRGCRNLEQERDQLKEEHQLMKSFLEQLVQWNSHGYVGAKEILDILNQKPQET